MTKVPAPPYVGPANRHGGKGNKPIKRIVLHSTVGPTKPGSARNIARMFNTTSRAASAHYIVDGGEVVQDLYDSYVAYHAPPNSNSLGVEICDNPGPSESRPYSADRWESGDHRKALLLTAELVAGLCKAYGIPIRKLSSSDLQAGKQGICGHVDISYAWGQTSHWDPGKFPWSDFIRLVKKAAKGEDIGAEVIDASDVSGGTSGGGGSSKTYTVVSATAPLGLYDKDGDGRTRVKDWQTDALGYGEKAADGYFGPDTEDDTRDLQRQIGVTDDGLVGVDTTAAWEKAGKPKLKKASAPKAPKFPLPSGHYFGSKAGPDRSHSGYYNHREHLRVWQKQMQKRGWTLKADGLWGSRTKAVALNFQKEKGLKGIDSLIGIETWAAAWEEPVT